MKRLRSLSSFLLILFLFSLAERGFASSHRFELFENRETVVAKIPTDGGIKEIVPRRFEAHYQKWRDELLTTEYGREQWEAYAKNKNFVLKIVVSSDLQHGAATGDYQWTEDGKLVGATIALGGDLEKGFPNPIYFPVMNSLSLLQTEAKTSGNILAAAKIAHEFGHVNLTGETDGSLFRLQNKLMPDYNKILLSNGYNPNDARLLDLAQRMGGSPVEIWENREYWGEVSAMRYLLERLDGEYFYCSVLSKMRRNVDLYAKNYENRFAHFAEEKSPSVCFDKRGD